MLFPKRGPANRLRGEVTKGTKKQVKEKKRNKKRVKEKKRNKKPKKIRNMNKKQQNLKMDSGFDFEIGWI